MIPRLDLRGAEYKGLLDHLNYQEDKEGKCLVLGKVPEVPDPSQGPV